MADNFLAMFEQAWRPLNPDVASILATIYTKNKDFKPLPQMTPAEARAAVATMYAIFNYGPPALPHIEQRVIPAASGPIRVRIYDPGVPAPAPTIVYFHGGGWVLNDIDNYDGVTRQLAHRSGMRVLSVDYALAPEHPFPVPLQDCVAAVRWAAREGASLGIDPNRISLAGNSAGANLALATCLALREAGGPALRCAALIYGCYSTSTDAPTYQEYGSGAYFMSTADVKWYWKQYLGDAVAHPDPLAAPLLANLTGLPPLYVTASEFDVLRDDSEKLVQKLKAAGINVEFQLWKGMIHAAVNLMGWIGAMGPNMDQVGAFLKRNT